MKIAIFYHAILRGGSVPIDTEFACRIVSEQMAALDNSGLLDEADELYIGVNGDKEDADMARLFVPCPDAWFFIHGADATTEIPTMSRLREWLPSHPDWCVLYHHIKGVTHPNMASYKNWRGRMESACVWNWRQCVSDLAKGFDAVGCHWLTPERFPGAVTSPFFGGTFWWATAKYLSQLPPLPAATWANRFEAESWIGRRRPYPNVRDYYPGWP